MLPFCEGVSSRSICGHHWDTNFQRLKLYVAANGHAKTTKDVVDLDGAKIGAWVTSQRQRMNHCLVWLRDDMKSPGLGNTLKAFTFTIGFGGLLAGAFLLDYPDWDVGVSLVKAFATLATAEWVASVIWQRRWGWMPLAVFWTWLSVYGVYWSVVRPEVMIREGQWLASLCLYPLCGFIWYRVVPMVAELMLPPSPD